MIWFLWFAIVFCLIGITITQIAIRKIVADLIYLRMMISTIMQYQVQKIMNEIGADEFKKLSDAAMNKMVDMNPPDIDKLIQDIFKRKGKKDGLGKD